MKLRTLLLTFLLVCGLALGAASHADASFVSTPTTLWEPTETGNQELFNFSFGTCVRDLDLYINAAGATQSFASGAAGNALLLQITPNQISASEFSIEQTNGSWAVYNVTNGANTLVLNLGQTNQFGLYYKDYGTDSLGNSPYVLQPTINPTGSSNQWYLTDGIDGCASVYIGNAAPVPIPGTFLLFGPGLACAFGFLRRFPG
jgi:hypothetical protein